MTKPKILNGTNLNPLLRLQKRLGVYRDHHNKSQATCNKIQETHNKINLELKLSLERKSKSSDTKVKKKRTANNVSINRKKSKVLSDKSQAKQFYDEYVDVNQNLSLGSRPNEFPEIDLDAFDISKDPQFSMALNEQELDGVLGNCCRPGTIDNTNNNNISTIDERLRTSLCANDVGLNSHWSMDSVSDFLPSFGYLAPDTSSSLNCPSNTALPRSTKTMKSEINAYNNKDFSVAISNSQKTQSSESSYNYDFSAPLMDVYNDFPSNVPQHGFYTQYVTDSNVAAGNYFDRPANGGTKFLLPTMSSGWYHNNNGVADHQSIKKPQLVPQQYPAVPAPKTMTKTAPTTTSTPIGNYNTDGLPPFYQFQSQTGLSQHHQYQQEFEDYYYNPFPPSFQNGYNHFSQPNPAGIPIATDPVGYYYPNYSPLSSLNRKTGPSNANSAVVNRNNSHLISNSLSTNINNRICRNSYPSHCI